MILHIYLRGNPEENNDWRSNSETSSTRTTNKWSNYQWYLIFLGRYNLVRARPNLKEQLPLKSLSNSEPKRKKYNRNMIESSSNYDYECQIMRVWGLQPPLPNVIYDRRGRCYRPSPSSLAGQTRSPLKCSSPIHSTVGRSFLPFPLLLKGFQIALFLSGHISKQLGQVEGFSLAAISSQLFRPSFWNQPERRISMKEEKVSRLACFGGLYISALYFISSKDSHHCMCNYSYFC